jgi:phage terminase small subunit
MSTLRNPKHEKFAQLVASGMTAQAAFTQAGYNARQNAPRLRNNQLVAKRIEELQARNERRAEMAALSRDELIGILTEIVHATRARLSEARPGDGLKAAEMLAKMCAWNEFERVNVQSVEAKVDAALIEQLRAGYAQLGERSAKACLPLLGWTGVGGRVPAGGYASQEDPRA